MRGDRADVPSLDRRLRRVANAAGFALLWCWLLCSMLLLPVLLGHPWVGIGLFLVGLVVSHQAWKASVYPVTTIGTKRRVDVYRIEERVDCEECGRPAAGGERRRYAREQVLFGTVVARPGEGENVYCPACADGIARESDVDAERERALERA